MDYVNWSQYSEDIAAIKESVAGKQAALTFDSTPTAGSTNPVTSDGIFEAIQAMAAAPYYESGAIIFETEE